LNPKYFESPSYGYQSRQDIIS